MKLHRHHWFVRFAYLLHKETPNRTTLCGLFWSAVGTAVFLSIPVFLIGLYVRAWVLWPRNTAFLHAVFGWSAGMVWFSVWWDKREKAKRLALMNNSPPPPEPSIVREAYRAVKQRVCPLIEIE